MHPWSSLHLQHRTSLVSSLLLQQMTGDGKEDNEKERRERREGERERQRDYIKSLQF